ncbi:MAG TPA: copper transporter [Mycobacterium sp.]|nr:copper transporter [Mycobacterium sp.]
MITLRHHVISLAAVFIALAIGVVLGSGLLSDSLLSGVRAEKKDLRTQINDLNGEKNALNEKLTAVNDFDALVAGRIVRDGLAGKSVVVFRTPDADSDDVEAVSRTARLAGATVAGTVSLTQEFVDANSAEKLRSVVTSSLLPPGAQLNPALIDQGSQAGDLLGIAVLINRDPAVKPADDPQRQTVLAALRDTGFISYSDQQVGAADTALVVTGGGLAEDAGNQGVSVARFAAALAPHGSGTLLAGRDGSAAGAAAVAVVRADAGMAAAVSTVDVVDTEAGRITAILGLAALVTGGHPGQYGIGPGATAVTVAQ